MYRCGWSTELTFFFFLKDDASAVNSHAVNNLAILFRSFVVEYLHIDIDLNVTDSHTEL